MPIYNPQSGALCTIGDEVYVHDPEKDGQAQMPEERKAQGKVPKHHKSRKRGLQNKVDEDSDSGTQDSGRSRTSEDGLSWLLEEEEEEMQSYRDKHEEGI